MIDRCQASRRIQPVRFVLSADAFTYHDISVSRKFENGFNVRLGVSNVLDEEPPFVTTGTGEFNMVGNVPITSQYDFLGRTVFLNVQKRF